MKFKKISMVLATAGALLATGQASATNWLKLQGTEDPGVAVRAKVWGFLQPTYQKDFSKITGPEPTRIGPNLETQEQFQLQRARIGVRGIALPLDSNVNYFAMFEMGHNAATDGGAFGERTPVRMMDASVTLNHLKGARVRVGLFKTPGPEEIFQGIPAIDYNNFSWVGNQLMLERFSRGVVNGDGAAPLTNAESAWDSSFGAARDTGIQIFDWFTSGNWTHSYAFMYGNGNGLEPSSGISDGMDTYLYWSSERNYEGGKGPWAHGWKTYAWTHAGKRQGDFTDNGIADPTTHDRTRTGIGTRYRKGAWRLGAEYMTGKGMIFQGPEKPSMAIGTTDLDGESDGYVLDVGYYVPHTKWELDARYDLYNRSKTHAAITAEFTNLTLGVQYHFNRKTRARVNYEMRKARTLDAGAPPPLVSGLAGIGDRLSMQVMMIF